MKIPQRTKDYIAIMGGFALLFIALAFMGMAMAQEYHSHSWLLSSSSQGTDNAGNSTKICNWRCASDRSHTTTNSGQVCTYPL